MSLAARLPVTIFAAQRGRRILALGNTLAHIGAVEQSPRYRTATLLLLRGLNMPSEEVGPRGLLEHDGRHGAAPPDSPPMRPLTPWNPSEPGGRRPRGALQPQLSRGGLMLAPPPRQLKGRVGVARRRPGYGRREGPSLLRSPQGLPPLGAVGAGTPCITSGGRGLSAGGAMASRAASRTRDSRGDCALVSRNGPFGRSGGHVRRGLQARRGRLPPPRRSGAAQSLPQRPRMRSAAFPPSSRGRLTD